MPIRHLGTVTVLLLATGACAAAPAANAPQTASAVSAPASPPPVTSSTPATSAPTEAEILAKLAPRAGETPADATPVAPELSKEDAALLEKCRAAKERYFTKNRSTPANKLFDGALKAMEKVSKRCLDIGLADQAAASAKLKDDRAQAELRMLAKGLAASKTPCGTGTSNPAPAFGGQCHAGLQPFLWDRAGWSCVAEGVPDRTKAQFDLGGAYVYSFVVDPKLRTYEIVGKNCAPPLFGFEVRTEIVLRGKMGASSESVDEATIYRRKLAPSEQ